MLNQTLTTEKNPQIGAQFGNSLDISKYATEIIVGTPFEVSQTLGEGAVYRYTNSGAKFGYITGTTTCAATTSGTILINGYAVDIPSNAGNAESVAQLINDANINNVTATSKNGILSVQLVSAKLATMYEKLNVSSQNVTILTELGFTSYKIGRAHV